MTHLLQHIRQLIRVRSVYAAIISQCCSHQCTHTTNKRSQRTWVQNVTRCTEIYCNLWSFKSTLILSKHLLVTKKAPWLCNLQPTRVKRMYHNILCININTICHTWPCNTSTPTERLLYACRDVHHNTCYPPRLCWWMFWTDVCSGNSHSRADGSLQGAVRWKLYFLGADMNCNIFAFSQPVNCLTALPKPNKCSTHNFSTRTTGVSRFNNMCHQVKHKDWQRRVCPDVASRQMVGE